MDSPAKKGLSALWQPVISFLGAGSQESGPKVKEDGLKDGEDVAQDVVDELKQPVKGENDGLNGLDGSGSGSSSTDGRMRPRYILVTDGPAPSRRTYDWKAPHPNEGHEEDERQGEDYQGPKEARFRYIPSYTQPVVVSGRLRSYDMQEDDTSLDLYSKLHRYPEQLEKRQKKREREQLAHERLKLLDKVETLKYAPPALWLPAQPRKRTLTGDSGRTRAATGTSSPAEDLQKTRMRMLREAEDMLASYDKLLPESKDSQRLKAARLNGEGRPASPRPARPQVSPPRGGNGAQRRSRRLSRSTRVDGYDGG